MNRRRILSWRAQLLRQVKWRCLPRPANFNDIARPRISSFRRPRAGIPVTTSRDFGKSVKGEEERAMGTGQGGRTSEISRGAKGASLDGNS